MSIVPHSFGVRRSGLLDDRVPFGGFGPRGLGAMAGLEHLGGLGTLTAARYGRGLDPYGRLGLGGGLGVLGVSGPSPVIARRDMLGAGYPGLTDALLRDRRYLDPYRRYLDDLLPSRLGAYRDIDALLSLGKLDRGLCDGRDDRRCEHECCLYNCNRCSGKGSSSSNSKDLKTKDIVVRGKTFKIRKSFLADAPKFEGDIVKLLDKKPEEAFPNYVVELLVKFINEECCSAKCVLDLVSLGVLASSLNVKSAIEFSLSQIKKHEYAHGWIDTAELADICVAILLSGKVDDKLVEWLKKHLTAGYRWRDMVESTYWTRMVERRPELELQVGQLVGAIPKDEREDGLRIL